MSDRVTIIGGGLAGCEAAWQLTRAGIPVDLYEMRPVRETAAHVTDHLGELVCSNSFRNATMETAVGLLKEEMRQLGSVVMAVADRHRVPAGACLAVDRVRFAEGLTAAIERDPLIRLVREEVTDVPSGLTILATGPLTSPALSTALARLLGSPHLYFYDAIAPTVTTDSIDMQVAWKQSRYDKGGDDYVNCPLGRDAYYAFVDAVMAAEKVPARDFERIIYFEGCMPIEEMARRGRDTLAFGPMRPVGLVDPRTGTRPFAAVQLRQDDAEGRLYNIVGFQTKMTYGEQRRVLRMIPGLERAEFVRLGSLHRNTYVNAPDLLLPSLQVAARRSLFLAGQIVGVEGYVESAATGILAGLNVVRLLRGEPLAIPPRTTAMGSMLAYVTERGKKSFQPMNANYGLFPPLPRALHGREKKLALAERGLTDLTRWRDGIMAPPGGAASVA
ncbi:MAG TPA: methylenetetrahydrofolate--tRNA-(uracil(54)-C(5))-methyltransferase (FADH(2)-oxidizing) TrmFO [Candidatus Eisenbacteria bacterium]|nr:methylenetetrahydrofolate--tRNA-(uracil(54)-C(5))-methyltransferase (FADH(2)-oxidizing) TrmFO [Candidatus Eisenbacteria bacterium]